MKSKFLLIFFSFITIVTFAQGNNGLVAHWNFNGNANDVSGNGLNGVGTNVTSAPGYNGIANTAYQFNGTSSRIDVANNTLLNMDSMSICVLIKPMAYYTGICQGNTIIARGFVGSDNNFYLDYGDNPYDNSCNIYTLSHEVFEADIHTSTSIANSAWYSNSDTITLNTWYCLTMTYNQDTVKRYIDGILTDAIYLSDNYVPGTDSLGIGYSAAGVSTSPPTPNWLNGIIDDIRLYNRALSAAEVLEYCDSAQMLPTNEVFPISNINPEIFIYPNPAHNNITIQFPGNAGTSDIQLINTLGQMIFDMKPTSSSVNIDISILPAGLYFIKAEYEGQNIFKKVLKD